MTNESLSSGGELCNHRVEDVLFKMDPHRGLNCAVLWSPSPAISEVLATLIPPPLPSRPLPPPRLRHAPHPGPRGLTEPSLQPLAAAAPRPRTALRPPTSTSTRLGHPLRPLQPVSLGVRRPQLRLRPWPGPSGETLGSGGTRIWAGLPGFLTQQGPLVTSRTVFGVTSWPGAESAELLPRTGPAPRPAERSPARQSPPSSRPLPRPRPRPLARSSQALPTALRIPLGSCPFSVVPGKQGPLNGQK